MNAAAMSADRMRADLGYVVGPVAVTDLFGADTTRAATAVLLVAAALLFARFAPEPYRAGVEAVARETGAQPCRRDAPSSKSPQLARTASGAAPNGTAYDPVRS